MTRVLAVLILFAGCGAGTKHELVVAKAGVVQCIKADPGPLLALTGELLADAAASMLRIGGVDWKALRVKAVAEGIERGGCAYAALYSAFDKQTEPTARSLDPGTPLPRKQELDALRAELGAGGWQLADGTVVR